MENNENLNMDELNLDEMKEVSGGKGSSAKQKIKATGDVYIREYPNKESDDIGLLYKGDTTPFLGEKRYDKRGVAWYKTKHHSRIGWVSSKYSKII